MTCSLYWVPHAKLAEIWPKVSPLIREAMRRGNLSSFQPVTQSLTDGQSLLWIAVSHEDGRERPDGENDKIIAAAVTRVDETEWRRVCIIVALGGRYREKWLRFQAEIEIWAREQKCSAIRVMGRRGWTRVLQDYHVQSVVLEKEL